MSDSSTHKIIDKLKATQSLDIEELKILLGDIEKTDEQYLFSEARKKADEIYGKDIYVRGLIEFTNYCKNDCYYCGIRKSNLPAERYRLTLENIIACCNEGYELGYRTFVLQGGEDGYFTDDMICKVVKTIKTNHPDCAVTLSIGEKSRLSYQSYFDAGADRYLLRHETADEEHYKKLHPAVQTLENRKSCLKDLKEIGYQVGCGFMVGSPGQSVETIYKDLQYIKELRPHMVGIGPFIPQSATPFANEKAGTAEMTLRLLSIIRLLLPDVLLPATTALGTINERGRELGILAGANVLMPNLSPVSVRKKYALYDNKICTGDESAQCRICLEKRVEQIGYHIVTDRGDVRRKGE